MSLKGKTLFITGASRGIGLAIALKAARDGANIVVAAKTDSPHPKLPGTIHSAAAEIEEAGGQALPVAVDIRHEDQIEAAVARAVDRFGGIDICINNASAISKASTADIEPKRYDLMHQINVRGTFMTTRACLPHLIKADNPHILNMSPPLNMSAEWLGAHVAYTMSKYGMTLAALGVAAEQRANGVAANTLWPRIGVATAAIEFTLADSEELRKCRKPDIIADAAYWILTQPAHECTGNCFIDDTVLYSAGVRNFDIYRVDPSMPLRRGLFIPDSDPPPPGVHFEPAAAVAS